jgi:hypothetical protein
MLNTIKHILEANEFMRLPKKMRRVVFYSEGRSYWPIFKGLIDGIIDYSELNICYISSEKNDPGLEFNDNHFNSFFIGDSYVRNWFFENLKADVMIMTMPDLNQYQVKRSKHPVHYIYVQHALVSLHMAYRQGAFDWFDTIFCSGPHHVNEIRCLEEKYHLPQKKILKHGYARLDSIIKHNQESKIINNFKHFLLAPSWGTNAAIELGLAGQIVDKLISFGHKVTLRPHPETVKSSLKIIRKIISKYRDNKMFFYDESISSLDSFYESDIMISDWSGAALEYSLGLKKPVLFLDLPKKINNLKYEDIEIVPLEVLIRDKIGITVGINDINQSLIETLTYKSEDLSEYIFNIGESDYYGVKYILDLAGDIWDNKCN